MNQIVSNQSLLFMTCIQIGIIMGVLFDLIRIIRKIIKHPDFLVQIQDLIYWIVCALVGFYMLYINNYAAIRVFVFIGIVLGAILYFATFSILFMKIATRVINYVKMIVKYLVKLLFIPIRWILEIINIPVRYFKLQLETIHNFKRRKLRRLRRKWNYTKAEIRTEIRIRKDKK